MTAASRVPHWVEENKGARSPRPTGSIFEGHGVELVMLSTRDSTSHASPSCTSRLVQRRGSNGCSAVASDLSDAMPRTGAVDHESMDLPWGLILLATRCEAHADERAVCRRDRIGGRTLEPPFFPVTLATYNMSDRIGHAHSGLLCRAWSLPLEESRCLW